MTTRRKDHGHELDEVARRVRLFREARGMSKTALAQACDLAPDVLSRLEARKRSPNLTTLLRLASALEVNVRELMPEEEKKGKGVPSGAKDLWWLMRGAPDPAVTMVTACARAILQGFHQARRVSRTR